MFQTVFPSIIKSSKRHIQSQTFVRPILLSVASLAGLRTHTHTHTQNVYDTYRLSTASIVSRTRLIVTLYVHCMTCLLDAWGGGYFYTMWRCAQKSTYFHVKCMLLFSDSNTSGIRKQYFLEFFIIKVNENSFTSQNGRRVHTDRRMDGLSEG